MWAKKKNFFRCVLSEFADVFSLSTKNLGHIKVLQHRIDTGNAQPVHLTPHRITQARRRNAQPVHLTPHRITQARRMKLRDMLEKNAIEQSDITPGPPR